MVPKKALKRTAFSVLATALTFSVLVGCGNNNEGQSTETGNSTGAASKDPVTIKVGI